MLLLDCPAGEIRALTARDEAEDDDLFTKHLIWADRWSCLIELGALPLGPGERLSAAFVSPLLPAPGEARAIGAIHGVSYPATDPIQEKDRAREFVYSVQGFTGGWKSVPTVVPARDPASLSDPSEGTEVLGADLEAACVDLAWIDHDGICRSLQAKLDQTARALERGQPATARGALSAFLEELDAQHGVGPGKHVSDNAYALLRTTVEFVLDQI